MNFILGMIVRNEAPMLKKTLSVLDVSQFAEMHAVDAGSNDGTVIELAKKGFTVCYREWDNHFAAARNYLLEKIRNHFDDGWLLMLDADEAMFHISIDALKKDLERTDRNVICLQRVNLFGEKAELHDMISADAGDFQPRCIRIDSSVHFRNALHEWPYESNQRCHTFPNLSLIFHYSLCKPAPEIALRWENYERIAKGEPLLMEAPQCTHDDLRNRYESEGRLRLSPVNFDHPLKDLYK